MAKLTKNDVPKISAGTLTRAVVLILALVNTVLIIFGREAIDVDEGLIYEGCSALFIIGSAVWGYWKDNAVTIGARNVEAHKADLKADAYDIEYELPEVEVEEVEFDEALYAINMAENGHLFQDKITDGIGEDIGEIIPDPDDEEMEGK